METVNSWWIRTTQFPGSYPTYEEWKLYLLLLIFVIFLGSYPTYEEWKHNSDKVSSVAGKTFLSYLWGMETKSGKILLKNTNMVLILPMRNGNMKYLPCHGSLTSVLILPMRNGNYITGVMVTFSIGSISSYPTYEEWKPTSSPS